MGDKATQQGAPTSRLDAVELIAKSNAEKMAEDNGLKVEDVYSFEPPVEAEVSEEQIRAAEAEAGVTHYEPKEGKKQKAERDEPKPKTEDEPEPEPEPKTPEEEVQEQLDFLDLSPEEEKRYRIKVKVDGEEKVLTAAEIKRGFQKDATASKRLEEAALRKKELDKREEELKRLEEELKSKPADRPQATEEGSGERPSPQVDDAMKRFFDSFYGGREDEAAAAMTELLATGRVAQTAGQAEHATQAKTVDETELANRVIDQLRWDDALSTFKSEYPDIVKDQHLARMADDYLKEELDLNLPYKEAFANTGERVRAWMREKGLAQPDKEKSRQEKKEELDNPSVASAVSTSETAEEKPMTRSQTISEMANERGANRQYQTKT